MKTIKYLALATLLLVISALSLWVQLTYPNTTEIRLFINFWWVGIGVTACVIIGLTILDMFKRR